ncbi:hypothetical protein PQC43_gp039 [Escherichia phage vB_EcoP-101114UKE3]|uniref:Uncharacterized protein n=1 Tax=Escherichia phage vB_EcoP-101114UKE3 TaxID=2865794 RepID=A0AAE7XRG2_9CAUD|nr:hypothetical protein PQC43_gp039 [Escherichia phage vB_EcoP-101114UKE3]QZI79170.1 hypothetical protein 101114UKE3_039 [Escherichia phage vB_EcoP-101114UKE3]USM81143.1 hypothetical protein 101114BS3_016 [Escherichia phage vB_EcoP-101114BS3]
MPNIQACNSFTSYTIYTLLLVIIYYQKGYSIIEPYLYKCNVYSIQTAQREQQS